MDRDPIPDARALVRERYPQALWAVLAGSVLTAHRTAGSDLDLVVVLPLGDPLAPRRESLVFHDWPAELFVHDEQTLDHWLGKEFAARKPTLHRMVGAGVALTGNPAERQEYCRKVLEAGPGPLSSAQRDQARYRLTELLDDLAHAPDPGERQVIAATLWSDTAYHALAAANCWRGYGKWLLRELRALDAELAGRWLRARDDEAAVAALAREVLDRLGGPLFDGYHAVAPRPTVTALG
ncbi:MAG: nucleotidyltransferase [Catenulispora sp. 13_1_20CM_3_70_7]|nr:nucleotidyltransferase domain-containing protein [Catenulisporales bacterium]OLE21511.1 MAG: nucleotidyltransferase [Catenulispora sp. 13_1_20CM_3_70_7]